MKFDINIDMIQKYTPIKGVFFFDAMIWLKVVAPKMGNENSKDIKYINFFDKVVSEPNAKIAITSLLVSEIINRYMKSIALPTYERNKKVTILPEEYKTKYKSTTDYKKQYSIICDEISSRSDSFIYISDSISNYDFNDIGANPTLDFNDYTYFELCMKNDLILVTDDADFFTKKVKILTLNDRLYNRQFS